MKHTFKEGDEVLVLHNSNTAPGKWLPGGAAGNTIILTKKDIKEINENQQCFCLSNNLYGTNFRIQDIELVKPKELIYEIY